MYETILRLEVTSNSDPSLIVGEVDLNYIGPLIYFAGKMFETVLRFEVGS